MTINDIYTTGYRVFENTFKNSFPALYEKLFGNESAKYLDGILQTKYGNKNVLQAISKDNIAEIISYVISINSPVWEKVTDVISTEYDILKPLTGSTEKTTTGETTETGTDETTDFNKVYNDNDFNANEKQTGTKDNNRTDRQTETTNTYGVGNGTPVSSIIQKEIALKRFNYRLEIIQNIVNEITIQIY